MMLMTAAVFLVMAIVAVDITMNLRIMIGCICTVVANTTAAPEAALKIQGASCQIKSNAKNTFAKNLKL